MNTTKAPIHFLMKFVLILSLLFFSASCSDNSSGPESDENGLDINQSVASVTGTITDDHEGGAFFTHSNIAFNIELGDSETEIFTIIISKTDLDGGVQIPSPGTYSIGSLEENEFRADYINYRRGGTFFGDHHYITLHPTSTGTITIESVSSNSIVGSFEFDAAISYNTDLSANDPVTVSGAFNARPE